MAERLKGIEVVELREISKEQAMKEILEYIKGKDRVWADKIAEALRIDLSLVNDILMELWSGGYVEPEDWRGENSLRWKKNKQTEAYTSEWKA